MSYDIFRCTRSRVGREPSPALPDESPANVDLRLGILVPGGNSGGDARRRLSGGFNLETLVEAADDVGQNLVEAADHVGQNPISSTTGDVLSALKEGGDDNSGTASPHNGGAGDEADLQPVSQAPQNEDPGNVPLPLPTSLPSSHIPSSLAKVAEYLQMQAPEKTISSPALEVDTLVDEGAENVPSEEEPDFSVASSHSVASRHSDLSSLSGARMRGLFHGTAITSKDSPVCPFPEEWQFNIIPEVIENEEDID